MCLRVYLLQTRDADVGVYLRCRYFGMPQVFLEGSNVRSVVQHQCRYGVPNQMATSLLLDASHLLVLVDNLGNVTATELAALEIHKDVAVNVR